MDDQLQELYRKFDGADISADRRLAYYGQLRASEMNHKEAIDKTYQHFKFWCKEVWPKRGIPLPED